MTPTSAAPIDCMQMAMTRRRAMACLTAAGFVKGSLSVSIVSSHSGELPC